MDIITGLETGLYKTGSLCQRNHDWNGTGQSVRYANGAPGCVLCQKIHAKKYSQIVWEKRKKETAMSRDMARQGRGFLVRVYKLIDDAGKPFYVGRTSRKLHERLNDHISASKKSKCPRAIRIKELIDSGFRPSIELLDEKICYTRDDAEKLEQKWIDIISDVLELTNSTSSQRGAFFGEYGRDIPPEIIEKMGKVSDATIAKDLRCTPSNVGVIRRTLGISAYNDYFEWDDSSIALLGTDSDPEVAKKLGTTPNVVASKRRQLNIPASPQFDYEWTEEILGMLGKVPDSVISKKLGMKYWSAVQKKRKVLGIPSFRESRKNSASANGSQ